MAEKLISITRKQHDAINGITETIKANQNQLATVGKVLLLGQEEELGQVGIIGARCVEGAQPDKASYFLVLEVPDIAPSADAKEA
jgi:hypothetical protein